MTDGLDSRPPRVRPRRGGSCICGTPSTEADRWHSLALLVARFERATTGTEQAAWRRARLNAERQARATAPASVTIINPPGVVKVTR